MCSWHDKANIREDYQDGSRDKTPDDNSDYLSSTHGTQMVERGWISTRYSLGVPIHINSHAHRMNKYKKSKNKENVIMVDCER